MDDVNINNDTSRLSYVLQSNHAYNTNKFKNCKVVLRKFMVYLTKLQWNMGLLWLVIGSNFSVHLGTTIGWSSLMLLIHIVMMVMACNTAFICETCRGAGFFIWCGVYLSRWHIYIYIYIYISENQWIWIMYAI